MTSNNLPCDVRRRKKKKGIEKEKVFFLSTKVSHAQHTQNTDMHSSDHHHKSYSKSQQKIMHAKIKGEKTKPKNVLISSCYVSVSVPDGHHRMNHVDDDGS